MSNQIVTEPFERWREKALFDALLIRDRAAACVMRPLRFQRPAATQLLVECESQSLQRFLKKRCHSHSLLRGADYFIKAEDDTHSRLYMGWYCVTWQGEALEVILLPGGMRSEMILCVGQNPNALDAFAQAIQDEAQKPAGRALRYALEWENAPDLDEELGRVTWDDLVLPAPLLNGVRELIEGFGAARPLFKKLGMTWRRGALFIGPPGTGKTMLCKAAAAALPDWPFLYVRDFRERMHHDAVQDIFLRARKLAPCLLVFEDIDGLLTPLNRTTFLNEMDGFASNEGVLILASSNHPGKIDAALLKRPSRFDRVFHITLPESAERHEYILRLLRRLQLHWSEDAATKCEQLAAQAAARSRGFTPAYLKEAFMAATLNCVSPDFRVEGHTFSTQLLQQIEELKRHLERVQKVAAMAEIHAPNGKIGLLTGENKQ